MSIPPKKIHNSNIPNDLLNDLSSRLIINVPDEERMDLTRLCFQIELAHWFYQDFYLEENASLPNVNLKDFIHIMFRHIPFLQKYTASEVDAIILEWREYKKAVPTFGAILLDQELKNVLLVQSFVSRTSWGFPKGKVNKDEQSHHCAIREVREETGFDISELIDMDEYLEHTFNDQLIRLYIITGVPMDAKFRPKTKNEIKGFEWFPVNQLPAERNESGGKSNLSPNSFFMVIPFVKALKKWIAAKLAERDKQLLKQQQIFALMSKNDYARYYESTSPAENRTSHRQSKTAYSPPPRMLRQKQGKLGGEDKKKVLYSGSHSEDKMAKLSKAQRKLSLDTFKQNFIIDYTQQSQDNSHLISKAWQNFSLDCEALVATFNISLRSNSSSFSRF